MRWLSTRGWPEQHVQQKPLSPRAALLYDAYQIVNAAGESCLGNAGACYQSGSGAPQRRIPLLNSLRAASLETKSVLCEVEDHA